MEIPIRKGRVATVRALSTSRDVQKWVFIIVAVGPALGGYLLFTLYPNLMSVWYSLLDWDGISTPRFVGLSNYPKMLTDSYVWRGLFHNAIMLVTIPVLTIFISLVLSYLITHKHYRENSTYRTLYFVPTVLPIVVIALLWSFIYDGQYGLLDGLLRSVGIPIGNFYWLGDSKTALAAIIALTVWAGVGFNVVIFTNAMSGIPKSLYEAAILEGASHMQRLFQITIPLVWPVIYVVALFSMLGAFKSFEAILILTNGGPDGATDVLGLYMFNIAFGDQARNYGYASTIGMFLFVILVGLKFVLDKFSPKEAAEY